MNKITSTSYSVDKRKVFVGVNNTYIDKIINEWYDNNIYSLKFKCKTWSWLISHRNKVIAAHIHDLLNLDETKKVKFSYYAGCRCGCSPGFLIKEGNRNVRDVKVNNEIYNNVWVEIPTEQYTDKFKELIKRADNKLEAELSKKMIDTLDNTKQSIAS